MFLDHVGPTCRELEQAASVRANVGGAPGPRRRRGTDGGDPDGLREAQAFGAGYAVVVAYDVPFVDPSCEEALAAAEARLS